MTWWTTVSGLTPMAAWDAARVSGDQILDGVGSNNLSTSAPLTVQTSPLKALQGNGASFNMASAITLPATGVVLLFIKAAQRYVGVSFEAASTNYLLCHWSNNDWYFNNNQSYNSIGVNDTNWGTDEVVVLIKGASTSQIYRNGTALGAPVPNAWVPATLDRLGQSGYWLEAADRFMAAGFWSGDASVGDIQALEVAVRAAMDGIAPGVNLLMFTGGLVSHAPPQARDSIGVRNNTLPGLSSNNAYFSGPGSITGTVKVTPATPVHRRVKLFHEASGLLVAQVWSDAATGVYVFTNLKMGERFTVIGYDHLETYRAVIADRVLPL